MRRATGRSSPRGGDLLAGYGHERPESSRHLDSLLALNPDDAARFGGRRFGLPRELAGLHALFEAGEAAVVGNVGPLVQATDRTSMAAGAHGARSGCTRTTASNRPGSRSTPRGARFGWGGQLLDATLGNASTIDALYAAITATDSEPFLAGTRARAFRVPAVGKSHDIRITRDRRLLGASRYELARALLDDYLQDPNAGAGGPMRRDVARASADGIRNLRRYNALADAATPFAATFPSSRLGGQLASVARAISLRDALGTPRQVFYVTLAGLDTHTGQRESLPGKHEQIGTSLAAFRDAMVELGGVGRRHRLHHVGLRAHARAERQRYRPRLGRRTTSWRVARSPDVASWATCPSRTPRRSAIRSIARA